MNVDFGIICLFTIQVGFVAAVYHAWRGIKAEIVALESLRESNRALDGRLVAEANKNEALKERITVLETAPKASKARMEEIEVLLGSAMRRVDAFDAKHVSLSARVSAFAKHRGKVVQEQDEEETAPAPQGEGDQIPLGFMPPGAIPLSVQPQAQASVVPPGFGVVGRRRHG